MTDVEDIELRKEFESLRNYLNGFDSLEDLIRHRKRDLTATQVRLFDEYYYKRSEQRELRRRLAVYVIIRRHHRVRVWRDERGRFARHR
jgi:hypothetical protein